jgi:hypothetical protein
MSAARIVPVLLLLAAMTSTGEAQVLHRRRVVIQFYFARVARAALGVRRASPVGSGETSSML